MAPKKPGLNLGLKDAVTTPKVESQELALASSEAKQPSHEPQAHGMGDISAVIARLERMEAENKRLRENQERLEANSPEAIIKARKERYN